MKAYPIVDRKWKDTNRHKKSPERGHSDSDQKPARLWRRLVITRKQFLAEHGTKHLKAWPGLMGKGYG